MLAIMAARDPDAFESIYSTCTALMERAEDNGEDLTEHEFTLQLLDRIAP
jgi:hypothetical protein